MYQVKKPMMTHSHKFELLLFSTNTTLIKSAARAGIHGFIVDWELEGKLDRQDEGDGIYTYFKKRKLLQRS